MLTYNEYIKSNKKNKPLYELLKVYDYPQKNLKKIDIYSFAEKIGVKTPKLLYVGNINDGLTWCLPNDFVLKPIDGCSGRGVFLMNNGINLVNNKKYSSEDIVNEYKHKQKHKMGYSDFYIVEELLLNNNKRADDIKAYCFKNNPTIIRKISRSKKGSSYLAYDFNDDWAIIYRKNGVEEISDNEKKILHLSYEKINRALNYNFIRIDGYIFKNEFYLGEINRTTGRMGKSHIISPEQQKYFGYLWNYFLGE